MSILSQVKGGKIKLPYNVLVHGVAGAGKTSFATTAPAPIFADVESGSHAHDVPRLPLDGTYETFDKCIDALITEKHTYKTLVVDTLDALERQLEASVCADGGVAALSDMSYGSGYKAVKTRMSKLLTKFEVLSTANKMNILVLAHSDIKTIDDPQTGGHDSYVMRSGKGVGALARDWAHIFGYAYQETFLRKDDTTQTSRVCLTGRYLINVFRDVGYEAKCRWPVNEPFETSWGEMDSAMQGADSSAIATKAKVKKVRSLFSKLDKERQTALREEVRALVENGTLEGASKALELVESDGKGE